MIKCYIKIIIIYLLRILLKVFYIFPVKRNRIIFSAYEGASFGCNPKYIFQFLYDNSPNKYEYVWCLNHKKNMPEKYKNVVLVCFLSIRHIYFLMTSKVIVTNVGIEPFLPKRKEQLIINTWHGGGAYKRVGFDNIQFTKYESLYKRILRDLRSRMTDCMVSSCQTYTDAYSKAFNIDKKHFFPLGMSRNDILVSKDATKRKAIRSRICKQYEIDENVIILLYAPTFRGNDWRNPKNEINTFIHDAHLKNCIKKRFGKDCIILIRFHVAPSLKTDLQKGQRDSIDVTDYNDMQDLLCSADILITDYSSSIWDFSFTYKPAFLFVPDLEKYKHEVSFITPIEQWPYPYAETLESLCNLIIKYDEKQAIERINRHHQALGSFEKGNATEKLYELIEKHILK